jgi:hypothetical protein
MRWFIKYAAAVAVILVIGVLLGRMLASWIMGGGA